MTVTIDAECAVCGRPFSYARPPQGRRRRFCSPGCKTIKMKFDRAKFGARERRQRWEKREAERAESGPDLFTQTSA